MPRSTRRRIGTIKDSASRAWAALISGVKKLGAVLLWPFREIRSWHRLRQLRTPRKRPPRLLTTLWLFVQLILQSAMITTICVLWHLSHKNKGIATVGDSQQAYYDAKGFHATSIWNSSIVWTTVPAWILSAYSAFWSAMLEVLTEAHRTLGLYRSEVKPFPGSRSLLKIFKRVLSTLPFIRTKIAPIQLPQEARATHKFEATTAKRTIMLDYGSWPLLNSFRAIYYGHVLLGLCLLLRAALWAAGGLSAAVFSVATVPFESPTNLSAEVYFDEYLGQDSGKGSNYSSATTAMDVVSATLVNNAADYPLTTDTHSFLPFTRGTHFEPGNYTADTVAYWATVECNVTGQQELLGINAINLTSVDTDEESAELYLHFTYGECDVLKWFTISNTSTQYGRSWATTDCSSASNYYRFGMVAGIFNISEVSWLSNLTVITCQPLFYRSNVSLTVSFLNDSTTAQVLEYTDKSTEQVWPAFARRWLTDTPLYRVLDPTTYRDIDTFSRLVLSHLSRNRTLDTVLPPFQLLDSFGTVFQAYYANFVTLQALFPTSEEQTIQGTVTKEVLRLFVVDSVAWAIVGILIVTFVVTACLTYHLYRNQHILAKHLEPILGDAVLFSKSADMRAYVDALEGNAPHINNSLDDVDLVEYARKRDLSEWVVWMERDVLHIKPQATPVTQVNGGSFQLGAM